MKKVIVLTGGPGTGKTSVIKELAKEFQTLPEAARMVWNSDSRFTGKSIKEINQIAFQEAVFQFQKKQFESAPDNEIIFSDRGVGDAIAYAKIHKLATPGGSVDFANKFRYFKVFILDPLEIYEQDPLRMENKEESLKIHNSIIETYQQLGYKIIIVPFMTVMERVNFIKSRI